MVNKANQKSRGWSAIFFMLFGFVFFGLGAYFTYDAYDFSNNAILTKGQVLSVEVNRDDDGDTYKPTFRYRGEDGQNHFGTTFLSSSGYNFAIGKKMDIYYDARDTSSVRLTGWFNIWGFGFIFMAVGLIPIFIVRLISRRKRNRVTPDKHDRKRDKYVRLESPESEEDHRRETEYTPTVRRY